ncbi:MAG: acyl--CoA ligase, partial [Acidimicrobiaceae bacterium]|nr:acyl--CoA ligase [Acidimicrobiaceae bacterium]
MLSRRDAIAKVVSEDPAFQLEDTVVRGVPWRVYRNAAPSLRAVLEATERYSDREFLVYEGERWTYAEHLRIVAGLARRWQAQGVGRGDRVAIAMRNFPEWVMTFWAAQALGAVAVPLNAWWTAPELAYALGDASPRVLVADGERLERIASELRELKIDEVIGVRARHPLPAGVADWAEVRAGFDPSVSLPDVTIEPDDDATILYTSGTTGLPKGAVASQRNHATNIRNTELGTAAVLAALGIPMPAEMPQIVMLQTFPFFHIGGLTGLTVATAAGAKLCLMYKWDTAVAAEIIQHEGVSAASMVPTLLRQLLDYAGEHNLEFAGLAGMASGGAPVPPDLIRRIEGQFERRISPANGYGLTETTSAVTVNSGEEYFAHPESVGRLVPGADIRVVDPDSGADLPGGE